MLFLTALILLNYETLHRATGLWRKKLILRRKKFSARVKRHVNEGVNLSAENTKQQPDGVAFGWDGDGGVSVSSLDNMQALLDEMSGT